MNQRAQEIVPSTIFIGISMMLRVMIETRGDIAKDALIIVIWFQIENPICKKRGVRNETRRFRDTIRQALTEEGVDAVLWQEVPIPGQALFQSKEGYGKGCSWRCPYNQSSEMDYRPEKTSISNDLLDRNLMIPLPPIMTDKDQEDLITAFRKVAKVVFDF